MVLFEWNWVRTMFALFEAGIQVVRSHLRPHVSAAPHVGLTMWHLSEVLIGGPIGTLPTES
jgi:hypothetical protein